MGPSRGLGGTLLGGWAKPAICGCDGSAASGGGYLATPPTFASCGSKASVPSLTLLSTPVAAF